MQVEDFGRTVATQLTRKTLSSKGTTEFWGDSDSEISVLEGKIHPPMFLRQQYSRKEIRLLSNMALQVNIIL